MCGIFILVKTSVYCAHASCDMLGIERLSLVSKVLMDTRLLELKRENVALKLKLFWKTHSPCMLKQAMAHANQVTTGPKCSCLACIVSGRCASGTRGYAPHPDDDFCHLTCQFKPWFEQKIREQGMSVGLVVADMHLPAVWVDGDVVDDANAVLNDGQHFSNLGSADWNTWVYGSRLWRASCDADPELAKLKALFETLCTM